MNNGRAKRQRQVLALACSMSALLFALEPSYAELNGQPRRDGGVSSAERTAAPDLALAEVYEEGVSLDDYWVSEKLDGVRAYWDGRQLISRGGHQIQAPADFVRGLPSERLDGELWMGRGRFEETSGIVRRLVADSDDWRDMRYLVFDLPGHDGPFETRLARLRVLLDQTGNPRVQLLEQRRIGDHTTLMAELERVVAAGGEGLMLRRDSAPYRGGRSNDLLKVKTHLDAEAVVVGYIPGKGKYTGMLGSLEVQDAQGRRFRVGSGLSDAERQNPPAVGSIITYRYRGRTERGIPRFATFVRVRGDAGLSSPPTARKSGSLE